MTISNTKFTTLISSMATLNTAKAESQMDMARTGQDLSWKEVERAKDLVAAALIEVEGEMYEGRFWQNEEEVRETMQVAGLAIGQLVERFAYYECVKEEKISWAPEADGAFCPDCGEEMKRIMRVVKNPQIEQDRKTVEEASFAWVSLLLGGPTAPAEEMEENRALAQGWAFSLGAVDNRSADVRKGEVSGMRARIVGSKRVEACERFLKLVKELEDKKSPPKIEKEGPSTLWVTHTCSICGSETGLEQGTFKYCRKDGGLYRQSQWFDKNMGSWRDYDAFLKVTADELVANTAFDMMLEAFLAGLWNNRKESNKALMTFGKLILKAGTEHVSEEQFLKGVNARMDLLLEGLQEFVQAFNAPVAKIFLALGADSQGPDKMKAQTSEFATLMSKPFEAFKKGLAVVSTTDALLRVWVAFFTGAVEGGMIYFTEAGMNEDDATKSVLVTIQDQGFPSLSVLKTLRKLCSWGAEGAKQEAKSPVDNSCMICGSRCGSSTYCGCQA